MKIHINKQEFDYVTDDLQTPLLWFIRDNLNLTGTKYGCGIGSCGSCMVLIDGKAVQSCLITVQQILGKEIITIEGVADSDFHVVQEAWVSAQVPQCGYCQSGQIIAAVSLLKNDSNPDEDTIKSSMSDVICRCGTYPRIIKAIKIASKTIRGEK